MKKAYPFIVITAVVVLMATGIYVAMSSKNNSKDTESSTPLEPSGPASISAIRVQKPNIVIEGQNLAKVEVWGTPTGTGITESNYQLLGIAGRSDFNNPNSNWIFPIPKNPMLLTEVFARGFDKNGSSVQMSLKETGATSIYDALWGEKTQESGNLVLKPGQTGTVGQLSLTFNSLVQDSRCPIDVECIQAGAVNTNVTLAVPGFKQTRNMPSDEVPLEFHGYKISIINIEPSRRSGQEIPGGLYVITFHIESGS
jgi:hypothetical protein